MTTPETPDKFREYVNANHDRLSAIYKSPTAWSRLLDAVASKIRARKAAQRKAVREAAHRRAEARDDAALYDKIFAHRPTTSHSAAEDAEYAKYFSSSRTPIATDDPEYSKYFPTNSKETNNG